MDLKDFDTKWFIGVTNKFPHNSKQVLRSMDEQKYAAIVAAQKLARIRS